jgi:hypothetical protein
MSNTPPAVPQVSHMHHGLLVALKTPGDYIAPLRAEEQVANKIKTLECWYK